jgi:hypothetical protein
MEKEIVEGLEKNPIFQIENIKAQGNAEKIIKMSLQKLHVQ